jgi:hypothetical protein
MARCFNCQERDAVGTTRDDVPLCQECGDALVASQPGPRLIRSAADAGDIPNQVACSSCSQYHDWRIACPTRSQPAAVETRMYYRYQETRYSGGVLMLTKSSFPVLKDTPSGVWVSVYGQRRFVKTDAKKRFACPTESEALESYHARKRRQVKILRAQLASAEAALQLQTDGETASFGMLV